MVIIITRIIEDTATIAERVPRDTAIIAGRVPRDMDTTDVEEEAEIEETTATTIAVSQMEGITKSKLLI